MALNLPIDEPDRVNAVVEGYFRIPAVWIGQAPPTGTSGISVSRTVVVKKVLPCGIEAYAMRNGQFLFDFLKSRVGEVVRAPGFRIESMPYTKPHATVKAHEKAEQISLLRTQIMNVHQAFLTSAEIELRRRSAAMGFPITAWATDSSIGISHPVAYHDDVEGIHAMARNVLEGRYTTPQMSFQRRVLEIDVVERSFDALGSVIDLDGGRYISVVEAAYQSACRATELRMGESIAIGWTACEQLVSLEWKDLLAGNDDRRGPDSKLSRDRKKKLLGRDYTASVMVEVLELNGKLDEQLYKSLEIARKARNNWAHDMKVPSGSEVWSCLDAIQRLLARRGIVVFLQSGFRGAGSAAWPIKMFQQVHGNDIAGFQD